MFSMKRIFQVGLLLALTGAPIAHANWATLTNFTLWSNTHSNSTIRLVVPGALVNPSGCTDPDSYMVQSTLSTDAQKRIYATLLAAKLSGKSVQAWVSGCESNRPAILNVTID